MTQDTDNTGEAALAARQLMQLWQKQMALLMQDPEVARSGLQLWQQMSQALSPGQSSGGGPSPFPFMPPFVAAFGTTPSESPPPHAPSPAAPPPNASGLADMAVLHQLLELQSRLAACERRVAELEAQLVARTGG